MTRTSYPNMPPRNDPDDLTFLSASAISWMASFSLPEVSIAIGTMCYRCEKLGNRSTADLAVMRLVLVLMLRRAD